MDQEIEETLNAVFKKKFDTDKEREEEIMSTRQQLIRKVISSNVSDSEREAYIQRILLYNKSRNFDENDENIKEKINENDEKINENMRTWHDKEHKVLGCDHYIRGAKMLCPECKSFFTCRICHDRVSNHIMDRYNVKFMACMHCLRIQEVAKECKFCKESLGEYYCGICHIWKDLSIPSFHCPHCNVCRNGKGLGIDSYHCPTCNCCFNLEESKNHKCLENVLHCNCPICNEYLLTSIEKVVVLHCGHSIHEHCLEEYLENNYICPICQKSIADMTEYFKVIDAWLELNPMPEEYKDMRRIILCNDCGEYNEVAFHFAYNKCPNCKSYNTKENEFLCKQCGKSISQFEDHIDKQADDSEYLDHMKYIPKYLNVVYDIFPEINDEEKSGLVYFNATNEKNLIILPEKKISTHFNGYNYQKIVCRHCKELVGYLYTPINGTFEALHSESETASAISLLDFCPYTKCWDVDSIVNNVLKEVHSMTKKKGFSTITFNSEFTIVNQTVFSPLEFEFSFLGIFSNNASSLFGYDYTKSPPEPFFSYYLSPSNETVHIDLSKIETEGVPFVALHLEEGDGVTEVRFKHCLEQRNPIGIEAMECRRGEPRYCRVDLCVGDFAILKDRRPEGSFFGLIQDSVVFNDAGMSEEFDSFDHFSYLFQSHVS